MNRQQRRTKLQSDPTLMKIWCLFSVDNDYNQPPNNLVAWWMQKPTREQLAEAIEIGPDQWTEELDSILDMQGNERIGQTDYRLEQVPEGIIKF